MSELANISFALKYAQLLITNLMKHGIDYNNVCNTLGLPNMPMNEITLQDRIPLDDYIQACKTANKVAGDELFCFKVGTDVKALERSLSWWASFLGQNKTLMDVGNSYIDNFELFASFAKPFWLEIDNDRVALAISLPDDDVETLQEVMELRLSVLAQYSRLLLEYCDRDPITDIYFQHAPRIADKVYNSVADCNIEFNKPYTALVMDREAANFNFCQPDEQLKEIYYDKLKGSEYGYASQLQEAISKQVHEALPMSISQAKVAENIGVSISTMKRQLAETGVSYQQVIDKTKSDLAKSLLKRSNKSIEEIAKELAFSSLSSFSQSFKRMVGESPTKYRKQTRN